MTAAPVPITFVDKILANAEASDEGGMFFRHDLPAGAICFLDSSSGQINAAINFICPCGCGRVGCVNINTGEKKEHAWLWDGNVQKPTLTPSIQRVGGCRWHGYLTAGQWITC